MPNQVKRFFRKLLDLREGAEEKSVIVENVKDDGDFSSARFWTLVFAIGVASVGLNINSTPVIIGAMLISPLMGPIVSMGLALSINDWGLMRRSFRNFLILTAISISISALYFSLSPITNAQSELLARTSPTMFDVLIAVFGGIAGFIGVSRARHNNVIPGVAIATALMPPLCTVGYGIGTLQPQFVFGAFYLFLINSIFICLSSLLVAKYLKLPRHEYADEVKKVRVRRIITVIIIVITVPAVYTAFSFVKQNNFNQHADDFVSRVFEDRGYVVIYENIQYSPSEQKIELAFLSDRFSEDQIAEFEDRLSDFGLAGTQLTIRQDGFSLSEEEWQSVLADIRNDDEKVQVLENRLESERLSFESPARLLEEARAINDKIDNLAIGTVNLGEFPSESIGEKKVAFVYAATSSAPLTFVEAETISGWLQTRLGVAEIVTYFEPEPGATSSASTTVLSDT
jgi:uncharacterized hydrophobic protein (TIGR00271 family)